MLRYISKHHLLILSAIAAFLFTCRWTSDERSPLLRRLFDTTAALRTYAYDDDTGTVVSNSTEQNSSPGIVSINSTFTAVSTAIPFVLIVNDSVIQPKATSALISVVSEATKSSNTSPKLDLALARELAQKLLSKIYRRYELHENGTGYYFWRTASNMGADIWDMVKYKLAKKALQGNQTFLMIFGGSSVTAGHDSYFNQSYPAIFDNRMSAIFAALGIQLVVHNTAMVLLSIFIIIKYFFNKNIF